MLVGNQNLNSTLKSALTLGLVIISCLIALSYFFWPLRVWLKYPLIYDGDGLWNLFVIKTVIENGWYGKSQLLGFPLTANFQDFPKPETIYILSYHLAGLVTSNIALIHNFFYFSGFVLVSIASFLVLRNGFLLSLQMSYAGALIYAFLPYHFLRIGHLFLSNYFVIPLVVWLVLKTASKTPPFFESGKVGLGKWSIWLLSILVSSTSAYYVFFAVSFISIIGLLESLRTRNSIFLKSGLLTCVLIATITLINLSPAIYFKITNGPNKEVAARSLSDTDIFALRPIQLIIPNANHHEPKLASLAIKYEANAPFINENKTSSLGILASIGFLFTIILLISGHGILRAIPKLAIAAKINLISILLSVAGGGWALFGLVLTPQFRATNRISVMIAFASLAGILILIDLVFKKIKFNSKTLPLSVLATVLVFFALWDQAPRDARPNASKIANEYENDSKFVNDIEKELNKNSKILQLPYTRFPEAGANHSESIYSHIRGFLHSDTLRWSYGGFKGRESDLWHRGLSLLPISEQIQIAKKLGFNGIWIERRAFKDGAVKLEADMQSIGLNPSIVSGNSQLAFYTIEHNISSTNHKIIQPFLGTGFYEWEGTESQRWAWSNGNASILLTGIEKKSRAVQLSFNLSSLTQRAVKITVQGKVIGEVSLIPGIKKEFKCEYNLPYGVTLVELTTDKAATLPGNGDVRLLAVSISELKLSYL